MFEGNLPVEIIDIILLRYPVICLTINKRYRDKAFDVISEEYDIDREDLLQYIENGITRDLAKDFKCYFTIRRVYMKKREKWCQFDPLDKENFTYKVMCNYMEEFYDTIGRDIYQFNISLRYYHIRILGYLNHIYEDHPITSLFMDCLEKEHEDKRFFLKKNILLDKVVQNTESLDVSKLIETLYYMKGERDDTEKNFEICTHLTMFLERFEIEEHLLRRELMKIQEFIEEKIYLHEDEDGFDIEIGRYLSNFITSINSTKSRSFNRKIYITPRPALINGLKKVFLEKIEYDEVRYCYDSDGIIYDIIRENEIN